LKDKVKEMRHHLLESIVEQDDAILHKYLEEHELSEDEIRTVLRKATISGKVVPVLAGAAFKNQGVQALLDAVVDYLPSPVDVPGVQGHLPHHDATHVTRQASDDEPFAALAFKIMTDPYVGKLTFFRVYSGVLGAGSYIYNSTRDKRSLALQKLSEEDPTFRVYTDAETAQTIISGMGELHLEIIVDRMKREFKVDANIGRPQVAYRETVRRRVEYVEGKFIRQTGGRGQYGHVVINREPGGAGTG